MLSEGSRVDYDESFDDRKGKPRAENVTGGIQGNDRGPPREAGICRDFQRGNCTRGPGCRFSHGDDRGGGGGYGGGGYGGGGRSNECFDFQKGRCTRGDSCRFSHGGGGGGGGGGGDDDDDDDDDDDGGGGGGGGGGGYGGGYDRDRYDDRDRDRYDDRRGGDRYDSYDRYDRSYDRG